MVYYVKYINLSLSLSSMSHPNGLSGLMNGRLSNHVAYQTEDSPSPVSHHGGGTMLPNNSSVAPTGIPNHSNHPTGYWSSLNYNVSGGAFNQQLELQSPSSVLSNYSLNRNY